MAFFIEKTDKQELAFGTWQSPITTEFITTGEKKYENIVIDGDSIYWTEMRPQEKGRSVLVKVDSKGHLTTLTPEPYSVRTRAHEYGGIAFAVSGNTIYFINDKDQRLYVQKEKETPQPLTEAGTRFADLQITSQGIIAIGEVEKSPAETENFLTLIDLKTGESRPIASGYDFYASPTISPDGKQLAWIAWNHPNMPWDGTELWVADFSNGSLENARRVAGGPSTSIFQPGWSKDQTLYFVSDQTGWWNLYRLDTSGNPENLHPMEAECGLPQWVFGMSTWDFAGDQLLFTYTQNGAWKLALLDPQTKKIKLLELGGTDYTQIRTGKECAVFLMGSPTKPRSVVRLDLKTMQTQTLSHEEKSSPIPNGYISVAQPIAFPSANGRTAYAYYYSPQNAAFRGIQGEFPPLIVKSHGGPTARVNGTFDWKTQYWTSRGFAVLDVNYGGSTGHGRAYRELLNGQWGIVDVEDCTYGAQYLVEKKLADPAKLAITGGSAGGYTTLACLTFGQTFTVGASYYGVSDLEALAKETHKFESRYLDSLVGPYPASRNLYVERSPISFPEKLACPVIFFQGTEDKVVPLDQAEAMYKALQAKGIPTKLILYEGEQHGFRKAENIRDSLEKELLFYLWVFYKYEKAH